MMKLFKPMLLLGCLAMSSWLTAGTFTPLNNQPNFEAPGYPGGPAPGGVINPLLLTDGSIFVINGGFYDSSEVWKLTPDNFGSYINGTWSQLASLPDDYAPDVGASAVLADGRVIVQGGEYNGTNFHFALTNIGYIYDPVADAWEKLPPPPFFNDVYPPRRLFSPKSIGDASSVILQDGTYMVQNKMSGQAALLDLKTMTWTETGTSTKNGWGDEEGWVLLPNGKVLTVSCYAASAFLPNLYPYPKKLTGSEIYDPKTGEWSNAGSTIVPLTNKDGAEIGPIILRPDGKVVAFGGTDTGENAIYDSKTNKWSVGPTFPIIPGVGQQTAADMAAALLPNGNILVSTSLFLEVPPTHFYELTYDTMELIQQPDIPNSAFDYFVYQLVLPTGQIFCTDFTNDVEIYTSDDPSFNPEWAPVVRNSPSEVVRGKKNYKISGIRFNGMSQGSSVGDDYQSATNYPLVRITNNETGHVFYCRTHDHSFMGVASNKPVHTFFDVPRNIERGAGTLEVVANGIPSEPVDIVVK